MIERFVLSDRAAVDALRRAIAHERVLYEVRDQGGDPDWTAVTGDEAFDFAAPLALGGAKRFFFPPREVLLRWDGDRVEPVAPDVPPFALFGLRACDLTAIAYQDRFFADDPWYRRRRGAALLVGVDCRAACAGGFCADVDAGPSARGGYDLNLALQDDGRVLLEVATLAGRAALEGARLDPPTADARMRAAVARERGQARASFATRPFVDRARARLDAGMIGDAEWGALAPRCLACTGCTNLCPTCSCFTVTDEPRNGAGERVRVWDSCLLEGFQREASGHHPAPRPADRVRRFWHHKLSRDFADFARPGCVGCGRCDVTCPGGIGALRVLETLGAAG
jgi:formate hydrogenlyase subunit 6/NADH:ubiquinone oxidoreductase subunit I